MAGERKAREEGRTCFLGNGARLGVAPAETIIETDGGVGERWVRSEQKRFGNTEAYRWTPYEGLRLSV